ncbi:MAG TPA: ABC transporter permease [Patescibacteria group bacterium]|nr:ABC transporter permease [Patescibacteria group bacterium]
MHQTITQLTWLVLQLTKRDIGQRYKGTIFGALWPVLFALANLSIYTFVFSFVMKVRWPNLQDPTEHPGGFALTLFAGLIPFLLATDVINRSPSLVLAVPNLVKKVPFPLIVLSLVNVASAAFQSLINFALLMVFTVLLWHTLPWTVVLAPLVYLPLLLLCLGISWTLSALGVFIRDLVQVMPLLTQLLMFATPIFYPRSAIPGAFQHILAFNPLTLVVEDFRGTMLFGTQPDWYLWGATTVAFGLFAVFGMWLFNRLRPAFSDVM